MGKVLEWDKLIGEKGPVAKGRYALVGGFTCFDPLPMEDRGDGHYGFEGQLTSLGLEFYVVRNEDMLQKIYPVVKEGAGKSGSPIGGPKNHKEPPSWVCDGKVGDIFSIDFYRSPEDPDDMDLTWSVVDSRPVVEPEPRYFLKGTPTPKPGEYKEMTPVPNEPGTYSCEVELINKTEEFNISMFKLSARCVHPNKSDCTQFQAHSVEGPDDKGEGKMWSIGKAAADKARHGDVFTVTFNVNDMRVSWAKVV